MKFYIIALLVGVIVLSVGISSLFNINFLALFAGLLIFLKSFKLTFVVQWLIRFVLIRLPQRVLTAAVKLYIIDRERMRRIIVWFTRLQLHWRTHYKFRLIICSVIGLLIAGALGWWVGLWILVIYEMEVILELVWRKIWPTISETIFVKALGKLYVWLKKTRIGQLIMKLDQFFEQNFWKRLEVAGKNHQLTAKKLLEDTLTYQLKSHHVPIQKQTVPHEHLLERHHKKFTRRSIQARNRRHSPRSKR